MRVILIVFGVLAALAEQNIDRMEGVLDLLAMMEKVVNITHSSLEYILQKAGTLQALGS